MWLGVHLVAAGAYERRSRGFAAHKLLVAGRGMFLGEEDEWPPTPHTPSETTRSHKGMHLTSTYAHINGTCIRKS